MPTRIAFWTSSFESEMEAIASEVATLRRHFPSSVVWGINHRRWAIVAPGQGYNTAFTREAASAVSGCNSAFGADLPPQPYLRVDERLVPPPGCARRRPTILTVALDSDSIHPHLLERVDRFVVEFEAARGQLLGNGISPTRIQTIFPPVNLTRFVPTAPPDGPFTVLFASSPELPNWLEARGLSQLLDAAGLRPEIRFQAALGGLGAKAGRPSWPGSASEVSATSRSRRGNSTICHRNIRRPSGTVAPLSSAIGASRCRTRLSRAWPVAAPFTARPWSVWPAWSRRLAPA